MIFALLAATLSPAPALADPPPPVVMPAPDAGADHGPRGPGRGQVFVAPSGAVFRVEGHGASPKAAWFAAADADHDGRLTAAEFTADVVAFAASLDTDHDGVIDRAELAAYAAALPEVHAPGADGAWHHRAGGADDGPWAAAPHRTPPPPGVARFALLPDADPVGAMDARHDGRITRNEVQAAAAARFAALDSAHRGFLTLTDLPETWSEARRREMRAFVRQHGWGEHGGNGDGWGGGAAPGGFGDPGADRP